MNKVDALNADGEEYCNLKIKEISRKFTENSRFHVKFTKKRTWRPMLARMMPHVLLSVPVMMVRIPWIISWVRRWIVPAKMYKKWSKWQKLAKKGQKMANLTHLSFLEKTSN